MYMLEQLPEAHYVYDSMYTIYGACQRLTSRSKAYLGILSRMPACIHWDKCHLFTVMTMRVAYLHKLMPCFISAE